MATEFSYEVLPFEQVERRYLELFARYKESLNVAHSNTD